MRWYNSFMVENESNGEVKSDEGLSATQFTAHYNKTVRDVALSALDDGYIGFTLVREYEPNTRYHKDEMKMFIRLYLDEGYLVGSIEMARQREDMGQDGYTLVRDDKYRPRTTGFYFGPEEDVHFDRITAQVTAPRNRKYTLNEFVDILEKKNHLKDRQRLLRVRQYLERLLLRLIFWLVDKKYRHVHTILLRGKISPKQDDQDDMVQAEPFFNYFKIAKNTLLTGVLIGIGLVVYVMWQDTLSIVNPLVPLTAFLSLFIMEKISVWMVDKVSSFLSEQNDGSNFVHTLYSRQWSSGFRMKY